ncbi:MAG: hypothetical protein RL392_214 [Pseudomonadota bacterium]|jgi:hypothetical protein
MQVIRNVDARPHHRLFLVCAVWVVLLFPNTGRAVVPTAAQLQSTYIAMATELAASPFKRPLLMQSQQAQGGLVGDIYAVVAHPMQTVRTELSVAGNWCNIMLLHSNTKYCRALLGDLPPRLAVYIGTKEPQELARSARAEFSFQVVSATSEYLEVALAAPSGPIGTSNYLIRLQAVPLAGGKTFLHFTYSYTVNALGRMAMSAYLMTGGLGKVGFTVVGSPAADPPQYIDGVLALLERNTMRYFLAIDTFLQFASEPSENQLDKRLRTWFAAVEQYPRQLHEMDLQTYLAMKQVEYARQQVAP